MKNNYELTPLSSVIDFENLVAGFDNRWYKIKHNF